MSDSPARRETINLVGTVPGAGACFLVLLAYAFVALHPSPRKKLDRVSFRLLVYTLAFHVFFGIACAATAFAPSPSCSIRAFAPNFFLCFSTFFTTCIALNLHLVLVHGVDGKRMEKYYILGTVLLALAVNVPAIALHQFGWDERTSTCWYKNPDPKKRLHWIIGTQSVWISLAATIESVCSAAVLVWMYRALRDTQTLIKDGPDWALTTDETAKKPGVSLFCCCFSPPSSRSRQLTQDPRYRNVILRIVLYPIVSLIVNYSTVALDLNMNIKGLKSQLDYRLLVLDEIMYGLRTLAYGLLAATDPAFINALREMRRGAARAAGGEIGRGGGGPVSGGVLTSLRFTTGRAKSGVVTTSTTSTATTAATMATTVQQREDSMASEAGNGERAGGGGKGEPEPLELEERRELERRL